MPVLELSNISKHFGAIHAVNDVSLTLEPGEVVGLMGDNGAGKSTLVKCIAGIHPTDSGEVLFQGEPVHIKGPRDAAALGIEVVYQDLALADNLDIVQNMFLGRERTKGGLLDETDMPISQVALVSGFGSIRRFNDAFRQAYDRPPSQVRRRRAAG